MASLDLGKFIEQHAVDFLQANGLKIICRNFLCKMGEIDIIASDKQTLAFVEVRYRKSLAFGGPLESITWRKQQKIIKTAKLFLKQRVYTSNIFSEYRFDVIAVSGKLEVLHTEWIQDAFDFI